MSRPARPWFRFYVEALADRKLRRLTPAQRWLWVAVLGAARMSPQPGVLQVAGVALTDDELADIAGMAVRDVRRALPLFEGAGMLERHGGMWRVTNWSHRQFESDDVTERTRKHRSRERFNDVPGNAPEAETEAETEGVLSTTAAAVTTSAQRQQRIDEACRTLAEQRAALRSDVGPGWTPAAAKGLATDHHQALHAHLVANPDAPVEELVDLMGTRSAKPEPVNTSAHLRPVAEILAELPPADQDVNAAGASSARAALGGRAS